MPINMAKYNNEEYFSEFNITDCGRINGANNAIIAGPTTPKIMTASAGSIYLTEIKNPSHSPAVVIFAIKNVLALSCNMRSDIFLLTSPMLIVVTVTIIKQNTLSADGEKCCVILPA